MVVFLLSPELKERPVIASAAGCCAVMADDAIRDELLSLPGVSRVEVDITTGRILVEFDPARVTEAEIAAALAGLGYPDTVDAPGAPVHPEPSQGPASS